MFCFAMDLLDVERSNLSAFFFIPHHIKRNHNYSLFVAHLTVFIWFILFSQFFFDTGFRFLFQQQQHFHSTTKTEKCFLLSIVKRSNFIAVFQRMRWKKQKYATLLNNAHFNVNEFILSQWQTPAPFTSCIR